MKMRLTVLIVTLLMAILLLQGCRSAAVKQEGRHMPDAGSAESHTPADTIKERRSTGTPSASPSQQRICDMKHIEKLIKNAGQSFPGIFGACFMDIRGGQRCGVNEDKPFQAASVVKVPIMYELFRQSSEGLLDIGETLKVNEADFVGGGGVIKDQKESRSYSLRELTELMITKSDNTATDLLLKRLGMESINDTMKKAGLRDTSVKRLIFDFDAMDRGQDNLTTPLDTTNLLLAIYEGRPSVESSREMLSIMKSVERRDMIPAGLPGGIEVAHKTGELSGVLLDAAIVCLRDDPYILCLMGQDIADRETAITTFATLSGRIYAIMK